MRLHNRVCIFICALLFLVVANSVQAVQLVDRIVAVVNGRIITLSELDSNIDVLMQAQMSQNMGMPQDRDQLRKTVLDNMINNMLIEDKAKSLKIEVSVSDVQNFIEDFKKRNNISEEEFKRQLHLQNKTRKDYEQMVKENILRGRLIGVMVQRKAVITDQEVRDYYNQHKGNLNFDSDLMSMPSGNALDISLIVLAPDEDPHELRKNIASGKITFEQAAIQKSVGPAAESGGHLGMLSLADLAPELREAASKVSGGGLSQPFLIDGKPALIFVKGDTDQETDAGKDASEPDDPEFQQAKEKIRALLAEQKMDKLYEDYTKRLREQAVVDIRL